MQVIPWDGKPISKPGLYSGVPNEVYHGQLTVGPSISASGLKTIFHVSAKHYFKDSYLNPNRKPRKTSRALLFGSACHHYLLGEAHFNMHYVVRPATLNGKEWNSNRNDCKDWLELCEKSKLTVLLPSERDAILGMLEGLQEHPLVMRGILDGLVEHTMVWQDRETGIWLKVRPDVIPTSDLDFADLKSAADVNDDAIERAIGNNGLNQQGALVGEACREVLGGEMSSFSLVFSEKAPPHVARVKSLKPADLELGHQQNRVALRVFQRCLETGRWWGQGGDSSDAEYAEIQPWKRKKIEERIAVLHAQLETAIRPLAAE